MSFKTETVEVEYNGQKVKVTVRELTFGEYYNLLEKHSIVDFKGTKAGMTVRLYKFIQDLTQKAIVEIEPPMFKKDDIPNLPRSIAEKISIKVLDLNPFTIAQESGS